MEVLFGKIILSWYLNYNLGYCELFVVYDIYMIYICFINYIYGLIWFFFKIDKVYMWMFFLNEIDWNNVGRFVFGLVSKGWLLVKVIKIKYFLLCCLI